MLHKPGGARPVSRLAVSLCLSEVSLHAPLRLATVEEICCIILCPLTLDPVLPGMLR
jgi:hypothetical protein